MKLTMIYHDLYWMASIKYPESQHAASLPFEGLEVLFFGSMRLNTWFSNDTTQRLDEQETGRTLLYPLVNVNKKLWKITIFNG